MASNSRKMLLSVAWGVSWSATALMLALLVFPALTPVRAQGRRPGVPPGILKQVEKAAEERKNARENVSTSEGALNPSAVPSPQNSPQNQSDSGIIDTLPSTQDTQQSEVLGSAAEAEVKEQKKSEVFEEKVFWSILEGKILYWQRTNGQKLLTLKPSFEVLFFFIGNLLGVGALYMIIKKIHQKRKNQPPSGFPTLDGTKRPQIKRISL